MPLRLHWIVLVVRGQLLNLIIDILTNQVALLDPSRRAGCGAHFDEAAVVVENFHAVAILHHSSFFIDRSNVVAQDRLHSGNVRNLKHASAAAIAGWQKYNKTENRQESIKEMFHRGRSSI